MIGLLIHGFALLVALIDFFAWFCACWLELVVCVCDCCVSFTCCLNVILHCWLYCVIDCGMLTLHILMLVYLCFDLRVWFGACDADYFCFEVFLCLQRLCLRFAWFTYGSIWVLWYPCIVCRVLCWTLFVSGLVAWLWFALIVNWVWVCLNLCDYLFMRVFDCFVGAFYVDLCCFTDTDLNLGFVTLVWYLYLCYIIEFTFLVIVFNIKC